MVKIRLCCLRCSQRHLSLEADDMLVKFESTWSREQEAEFNALDRLAGQLSATTQSDRGGADGRRKPSPSDDPMKSSSDEVFSNNFKTFYDNWDVANFRRLVAEATGEDRDV